jgi:hypothetical protein
MKKQEIFNTIIIDNSTITIYRQYEKKLKLHRYSYDIKTSIGWMANGGFGLNNQITHPTYESILTSAFNAINIPKETIRQYKLETILLQENDN